MGEFEDEDREARTPLETYKKLQRLARAAYSAIDSKAIIDRTPGDAPRNLRIQFIDDGFLDVWISGERYSYHWESTDRTVRFGNAPHHDHIETAPHHRHVDGSITESPLVGDHVTDFRSVMDVLADELA